MTDLHDNVNRLIRALGDPEPPQRLRGRTLARAQAAWARPAADRWLALWNSRPLRLTWAGAVLALVVANVAVRTFAHANRSAQAPSVASSLAARGNELQSVVALPRLRAEYVAIGAASGNAAASRVPNSAQPLQRSEDKS